MNNKDHTHTNLKHTHNSITLENLNQFELDALQAIKNVKDSNLCNFTIFTFQHFLLVGYELIVW